MQPTKFKIRAGGIVSQVGFNTYFSDYLWKAACYIRKLSSQDLKNILLILRKSFESPRLIASIIRLFPMFMILRKCAAGDVVLSLIRLKKGPSWNSLSRFSENLKKALHKIEESDNMLRLRDFSNLYCS